MQWLRLHAPLDSVARVRGWVRSVRKQKGLTFVEVNDGSSVKSIQVCGGGLAGGPTDLRSPDAPLDTSALCGGRVCGGDARNAMGGGVCKGRLVGRIGHPMRCVGPVALRPFCRRPHRHICDQAQSPPRCVCGPRAGVPSYSDAWGWCGGPHQWLMLRTPPTAAALAVRSSAAFR